MPENFRRAKIGRLQQLREWDKQITDMLSPGERLFLKAFITITLALPPGLALAIVLSQR